VVGPRSSTPSSAGTRKGRPHGDSRPALDLVDHRAIIVLWAYMPSRNAAAGPHSPGCRLLDARRWGHLPVFPPRRASLRGRGSVCDSTIPAVLSCAIVATASARPLAFYSAIWRTPLQAVGHHRTFGTLGWLASLPAPERSPSDLAPVNDQAQGCSQAEATPDAEPVPARPGRPGPGLEAAPQRQRGLRVDSATLTRTRSTSHHRGQRAQRAPRNSG